MSHGAALEMFIAQHGHVETWTDQEHAWFQLLLQRNASDAAHEQYWSLIEGDMPLTPALKAELNELAITAAY